MGSLLKNSGLYFIAKKKKGGSWMQFEKIETEIIFNDHYWLHCFINFCPLQITIGTCINQINHINHFDLATLFDWLISVYHSSTCCRVSPWWLPSLAGSTPGNGAGTRSAVVNVFSPSCLTLSRSRRPPKSAAYMTTLWEQIPINLGTGLLAWFHVEVIGKFKSISWGMGGIFFFDT